MSKKSKKSKKIKMSKKDLQNFLNFYFQTSKKNGLQFEQSDKEIIDIYFLHINACEQISINQ